MSAPLRGGHGGFERSPSPEGRRQSRRESPARAVESKLHRIKRSKTRAGVRSFMSELGREETSPHTTTQTGPGNGQGSARGVQPTRPRAPGGHESDRPPYAPPQSLGRWFRGAEIQAAGGHLPQPRRQYLSGSRTGVPSWRPLRSRRTPHGARGGRILGHLETVAPRSLAPRGGHPHRGRAQTRALRCPR